MRTVLGCHVYLPASWSEADVAVRLGTLCVREKQQREAAMQAGRVGILAILRFLLTWRGVPDGRG